MAIEVLRATSDQLEDVASLFSGYRSFYRQSPDPAGEKEFLQERLANGDSVIFLAYSGKPRSPAGFVQLYPMYSSVRMRSIWILNDLFVSKEFRGAGVANTLMEIAEKMARKSGAAGLELATEINNATAKTLYEKRGWTEDVEFDHYSLNF